jgi:GrpB-like predicted nucleotidyltransferase (UPF0157 family)
VPAWAAEEMVRVIASEDRREQALAAILGAPGLRRGTVALVDDGPWAEAFAALAAPLRRALPPGVAVEHVGSTAVPGLAAKPILDIDVVIDSWREFDAVKLKLEALGYRHEGDLGIPEREAFRWTGGAPAHHLYVCASSSPELQRHLKFRNILKADPVLAARYAALKRSAAERYRHDREGYTGAKAAFIEAVLQ